MIGLDSYSRQAFVCLDPVLVCVGLWVGCLFGVRGVAVCFLWLSLPGGCGVAGGALLAETT